MVLAAGKTSSELSGGEQKVDVVRSDEILRHGDDDSGDLIVKLCTLDGQALLFRREYDLDTGVRHWACVLNAKEKEVDESITKQCGFDPDLWVMEIEDAKGRHFLDVKPS